jgi:transposase-like protein
MPQKYDIEADQLKCNFCTQWFKCSVHFANLQRYSLKACPHCFQNFNYTILHPGTHKIFKVMLIDTNIVIPKPNEEEKNVRIY